MVNRSVASEGAVLFLLAVLVRFIAVGLTTVTNLNPYSPLDADGFAKSAEGFAMTIQRGSVPAVNGTQIYDLWGVMLSPFWLLPGPSRVYARIGMAILGAVAAYNVFVIGRSLHSRQAGLVAILPFLCYPSFILTHASVLREAAVIFGITTTARLLIAPSTELSKPVLYSVAGLTLYLATILRSDNLLIYALVLVTGFLVSIKPVRSQLRERLLVTAATLAGLALMSIPYARDVVEYLGQVRRNRAAGRTEYIGWVFPDTLTEAVAFSWIGVAYFLFSPFPWMVETGADFVVASEAVVNVMYAGFALLGARHLVHRRPAVTVALVVGIIFGSVLYGLGTANVGTAVRHRQMILWAIFILGAVGFSSRVELSWTSRGNS